MIRKWSRLTVRNSLETIDIKNDEIGATRAVFATFDDQMNHFTLNGGRAIQASGFSDYQHSAARSRCPIAGQQSMRPRCDGGSRRTMRTLIRTRLDPEEARRYIEQINKTNSPVLRLDGEMLCASEARSPEQRLRLFNAGGVPMSAPFRIERPDRKTLGGTEDFKQYLERLLKMIPGEIVGLYMIGSGFLPDQNLGFSAGWTLVCLVLLIIVRVFGTAAPPQKPPQGVPVAVAVFENGVMARMSSAVTTWVAVTGSPLASVQVAVAPGASVSTHSVPAGTPSTPVVISPMVTGANVTLPVFSTSKV